MTRAELVARLAAQQHYLSAEDVELVVKTIVDQLTDVLARGERIEIRGFGAFSLRTRKSRVARRPQDRRARCRARQARPVLSPRQGVAGAG